MILLSELSRRRIRSINKLVRVGRTEIVMVIRVDKEKGKKYFDTTVSVRSLFLLLILLEVLIPILY